MRQVTEKLKLIAVTRVKNEADIIEAFVRHHVEMFDKLIVLDDGSTDATPDILRSLRQSGAPLVLLDHPTIGYDQKYWMTKLVHLACESFGADWVAPLDVDEFLECADRPLDELLAELPPDTPAAVLWSNFSWSPDEDEIDEPNPVVRLTRRLPPRQDSAKLIVPASLVTGRNATLWQGNHGLDVDGKAIAPAPLTNVALCHYPIRSAGQYAQKVAVGHLQYLSDATARRGHGFQYAEAWPNFLAGGDQWLRFIEAQSLSYANAKGPVSDGAAIDHRLAYRGKAVELAPRSAPLADVFRFAESLARAYRRNAEALAQANRRADDELALVNRRHSETLAQVSRASAEALAEEQRRHARALADSSRVNAEALAAAVRSKAADAQKLGALREDLGLVRQKLKAVRDDRDKFKARWTSQTRLGRWISRAQRGLTRRWRRPTGASK